MGKLHKAAKKGDLEGVRKLLAAGQDINDRDKLSGYTPLHWAVVRNHPQLVGFLIEAGAEVDARAKDQQTPLHLAVDHRELMALLLARGADVDARDEDGHTPLHLAAAAGDAEIVRFLLESGADVDARDDFDATPLREAAFMERVDVVRVLLAAGADVDARDHHGETALQIAMKDAAIVRLLLAAGADVDARDNIGETPLYVAARFCHPDAVRLLLEAGADPEIAADDGLTPFAAVGSGKARKEILETLQAAGAYDAKRGGKLTKKLTRAIDAEDLEAVRGYLADGADVSVAGHQGEKPLIWALNHRWSRPEAMLPLVQLLIEHGADVNERSAWAQTGTERHQRWNPKNIGTSSYDWMERDSWLGSGDPAGKGLAPLDFAATFDDDAALARLLIDHGAEVDAKGEDDETALHLCVLHAAEQTAKVLIEAGADVNARTAKDGQTPLAWASRYLDNERKWYDDRAKLRDEPRSRVEAIAALLRDRGGVE